MRRLSFFCALLATWLILGPGALPSTAQGNDEQDLAEQVREFKRFYRTYKDKESKIEAIKVLKGVDCPEAAQALFPLLSDRDPEIVQAAVEVISSFHKEKTLGPFLEILPKLKDPAARSRLVEILGRAGFVQAAPVLRGMLKKERDVPTKVGIARALGRFKDKESVPCLARLLKDRAPQVRMAALDALAEIRDKKSGNLVVPLLKDPDWRVRSAAIHAARVIRIQAAVEPLIDLLGEKQGRLRMEAADALVAITDCDYGDDQAMWKKQWARLKSLHFKIPTDDEMARRKRKRFENQLRYKKFKKTTTYNGITTTSKRMLFVIDISGSMRDLVVDREKFKEGGYKSFQKLEIVKTELIRTIENLRRDTYFNILAFATRIKLWKKKLVQANILNRSSAISWVKSLHPMGAAAPGAIPMGGMSGGLALGKTNSMGALLAAFGLPPDKIPDERTIQKMGRPRNDLDTIFFLSDGRPSTGIYVDRDDILRTVRMINRYRKIVIHTIAIGEFQKDFLAMLARQNGGQFVDLGR